MRPKSLTIIIAIAWSSASLWATESIKRPITPEDIVSIRSVTEPQISPEAKSVAFIITEPADTSKSDEVWNSDIWIVPADGSELPRKYAFGSKLEIMPRWSPDGRYLAFLSNRGKDDKNQIYLLPVAGGEAEVLTSMKAGVDLYKWDPGSHAITFISKDSLTTNEDKLNKAKDDERVLDENLKYARLYRVDLVSRAVTLLTQENESVDDFDYSPDGSMLAFKVAPTPKLDDVYLRSKLLVMNRDGSDTRVICEPSVGNIRWSPDGNQIVHFTYRGPIDIWFPEIVSPSGGQSVLLGMDYRGTIWEMDWIPQSQEILVSSQEGVQGIIARLDTKTGEIQSIRSVRRPFKGSSNWSLSADGKWIAYLDASATSPNDIWIMQANGSKAKRLTDINPQLTSLAFGAVEKIHWNSKDGTQIEGVLVKPLGFESGTNYPLIVIIHGGPKWAWWYGWLCSWHTWAQLLASNGFAVLLPNPRGSEGYGWEFQEMNFVDWGGGDFDDIMSGVDYLIQHGIADSNRVAVGGWSYGGYMTAWAVTQTNQFEAAVMVAGLSNLTSFYGTTDIPTLLGHYFDGYPFGRQEVYDAHSPLAFVKNVRTPTMILHGEADDRVPVSQSYEFYRALKDMGVEASLVVYPREPHSIGERTHQIDLLQRVLGWYTTHLMAE